MKQLSTTLLLSLTLTCTLAQEKPSSRFEPGQYIITDSASTLMIPVLYNASLFSSNKLGVYDDFYANLVFYDFVKDSSTYLFPKETYIRSFQLNYYFKSSFTRAIQIRDLMDKHVILYQVIRYDHNKNGKIDRNDPSLLYVSDAAGNNLRELTTESESVVSVNILPKQNIAMIKFQRDANHDGDFKANDNDYYFRKLDLKTLVLGGAIEIVREKL